MEGHYDRAADIAWLRLDGWDPDRIRIEETPRGLIERDRSSGRILGLEYWKASQFLPAEFLDALPAPPARSAGIGRQPV